MKQCRGQKYSPAPRIHPSMSRPLFFFFRKRSIRRSAAPREAPAGQVWRRRRPTAQHTVKPPLGRQLQRQVVVTPGHGGRRLILSSSSGSPSFGETTSREGHHVTATYANRKPKASELYTTDHQRLLKDVLLPVRNQEAAQGGRRSSNTDPVRVPLIGRFV